MTDPNSPAYPSCVWIGDLHSGHTNGLTIRQRYAMAAPSEYMNSKISSEERNKFKTDEVYLTDDIMRKILAERAFKWADAMIEFENNDKNGSK